MKDAEFIEEMRNLPLDDGGCWVARDDMDKLISLAVHYMVLGKPKIYKNYKQIPPEYLRNIFSYDPETGIFIRKETGLDAGNNIGQGYIGIKFAGFCTYAHRMAWLFMTGEWPDQEIDHINRIRSDNRYSNLRLASRAEQCANVGKHRDGKGPYKGTHQMAGKWRACMSLNGRTKHLGTFQTPEEAKKVYDDAVLKHRGNLYVE